MSNHGLNEKYIDTIRQVLAPYAERIDTVGLFGSRATGTARPNSDIDMVLYGTLDEATLDRIWTLFDESNLPVKVDVNAYDLIRYPPLKAHIDAVMQPLLTKAELIPIPFQVSTHDPLPYPLPVSPLAPATGRPLVYEGRGSCPGSPLHLQGEGQGGGKNAG